MCLSSSVSIACIVCVVCEYYACFIEQYTYVKQVDFKRTISPIDDDIVRFEVFTYSPDRW